MGAGRARQPAPDRCLGRRGWKTDPLYCARRTLLTGHRLLTPSRQERLKELFSNEVHVEVEATWGICQRMIAAYRDPDRARGRETMRAVISSIGSRVPAALREVCRLGRTLTKRVADVLAYFDRPGTSNGPTKRSTADWNTCAAVPWASET